MTAPADHTGKTYGAAHVIGLADFRGPGNMAMWDVLWQCCGHRETIHVKRVGVFANKPPSQCRDCYEAGNSKVVEVDKFPPPAGSVEIPGCGPGCGCWIPLSGPMGMRSGKNGTHTRYGSDGYGERL